MDLELLYPHIHMRAVSIRHAEQTGSVMIAYQEVLLKIKPHLVAVVRDVNSTMACIHTDGKVSYPPPPDRPTQNLRNDNWPKAVHLEAGLSSKIDPCLNRSTGCLRWSRVPIR